MSLKHALLPFQLASLNGQWGNHQFIENLQFVPSSYGLRLSSSFRSASKEQRTRINSANKIYLIKSTHIVGNYQEISRLDDWLLLSEADSMRVTYTSQISPSTLSNGTAIIYNDNMKNLKTIFAITNYRLWSVGSNRKTMSCAESVYDIRMLMRAKFISINVIYYKCEAGIDQPTHLAKCITTYVRVECVCGCDKSRQRAICDQIKR